MPKTRWTQKQLHGHSFSIQLRCCDEGNKFLAHIITTDRPGYPLWVLKPSDSHNGVAAWRSELSTMNSYQPGRQLTQPATLKGWKGSVSKFFTNSWVLHYDNVLAHTALSVREFLAETQHAWHPLYSPDLATCGFFCSQVLQNRKRNALSQVSSKECTLMMLMTLRGTKRQLWKPYDKISSRTALKDGRGVGITV